MTEPPDGSPAGVFGQRIRALRRQLRLSQTAFGELLGVAQPTVARWENGRHMPDEATILKLASVVKATPATLRYGATERLVSTTVPVLGELGAGWQLRWLDRDRAPEQVPSSALADASQIAAIRVQGTAVRPLGEGWLLLYAREARQSPRRTLGKLAVVQPMGADHALVGELSAAAVHRRFDLSAWDGTVTHDLLLAWAAPVIEIRPQYSR